MKSSIRKKKCIGATSGPGGIKIPDPRLWPQEIVSWYANAVGPHTPRDVFIFMLGKYGVLFLQDAITGLAFAPTCSGQWHTRRGFPTLTIDATQIDALSQQLAAAGYVAHVMVQGDQSGEPEKNNSRARVIDISTARQEGNKA